VRKLLEVIPLKTKLAECRLLLILSQAFRQLLRWMTIHLLQLHPFVFHCILQGLGAFVGGAVLLVVLRAGSVLAGERLAVVLVGVVLGLAVVLAQLHPLFVECGRLTMLGLDV
jgi:hypothetical protein